MKSLLNIATTIILLTFISCGSDDPNENVDERNIEGRVYTNQELGWTITIPDGWDVIEMDEIEELNEKGEETVEETFGSDFDPGTTKDLISFKKDDNNNFFSFTNEYDVEIDGEWLESFQLQKEMLYELYTDQIANVDTTITTTEVIDNKEFFKYDFIFYKKNNQPLFTQSFYSSYIDGIDFGVTIQHNDEKYKEEMLTAWRGSKFSK